ncbi:MAG: hypothetical protein IKY57_00850 [Alistipes sp.]|nr:hypothetical protein [Alistipes sp.]
MAQDLLVKRNGEQMRVKVLKITKKKVEFVRHGTELPVYTLPISDIDYIEYPLGDRDTFNRPATTQTAPAPTPKPVTKAEEPKEPKRWHGAVAPNQQFVPIKEESKPEESVTTNKESGYTIGDIYDKDGLKGVIVILNEDRQHGVIMSLDEACLAWCKLHRKSTLKIGADDKNDGAANMEVVEKYIRNNNLSWSDFPAFEWCRAKGEGWYLPSISEIWNAGTTFMGGSRTVGNRRYRKSFNENIEAAGGTPLSSIMYYHSSTEDKEALYSMFTHMNSEPPYIQSGYKADDLFVRAFHKF